MVRAEAQSIVDEIAHKMALPAVRTIASVLRSVLTRVLDAIYVNTSGLELVSPDEHGRGGEFIGYLLY